MSEPRVQGPSRLLEYLELAAGHLEAKGVESASFDKGLLLVKCKDGKTFRAKVIPGK